MILNQILCIFCTIEPGTCVNYWFTSAVKLFWQERKDIFLLIINVQCYQYVIDNVIYAGEQKTTRWLFFYSLWHNTVNFFFSSGIYNKLRKQESATLLNSVNVVSDVVVFPACIWKKMLFLGIVTTFSYIF